MEQMQQRRARVARARGPVASKTDPQAKDRRREGRGISRAGTSQDATANLGHRRQQRAAIRLLELGEAFGGGLAAVSIFVVTMVLGLVSAIFSPREFVRRLREAPTRLRSSARRVGLSSKDPHSRAGRLVEASRLSVFFLREELADMRDGFPKGKEVARVASLAGRWVGERLVVLTGFVPGVEGAEEARERVIHAASLGLIAGAVVVGIFISSFQGMEVMKSSDSMLLQHVEVFGLSQLSESEFLAGLDAKGGDNLLHLDLEALTATALEQPWVERVEVERDLRAQSLSFHLHERRPAMLLAGASLKLVDDQGAVFKTLEAGDPVDFPVLSFEGEVSPEVRRRALADAIRILHSLTAGRTVTHPQLSELHFVEGAGFTLVTRNGLPIHIGSEDFAARLGRLERAVASGDLPLEAVASVDVSLRDRLVVVPRSSKKARKRMQQAVKNQPVRAERRSRMIHLKRVVGDLAGDGELTL